MNVQSSLLPGGQSSKDVVVSGQERAWGWMGSSWEEGLWKDKNPGGQGGGNGFSPEETTDPEKCPRTSKIPPSGVGSQPASVMKCTCHVLWLQRQK